MPRAGPQRKWPRAIPIAIAIANAQPGKSWTASRTYTVIGLFPVNSAQVSNASMRKIAPTRAVMSNEMMLTRLILTSPSRSKNIPRAGRVPLQDGVGIQR